MGIYESYAAKVCRENELSPGIYTNEELNVHIASMPFGPVYAEDINALPRLGQEISLQQHMQDSFFGILGDDRKSLLHLVKPVLISRRLLAAWDTWADWQTLEGYLAGSRLVPYLVFKNTVHNPYDCDESDGGCCSSDVRVMFNGPPYSYSG